MRMRLVAKLAALSALAAVGVLLAVALPAQGSGLAATTDTTATEPASTEVSTIVTTVESTAIVTNTVEQTTTRQILVPTAPTTTATESSSDNGTPAWVWALLAILGVGLIVFAVLLATRRGGHAVSPEERRRRLDGAVTSWVAQGWAIDSQDGDSAVLRRVGDLVLVQVDAAGHVTARPLGTS